MLYVTCPCGCAFGADEPDCDDDDLATVSCPRCLRSIDPYAAPKKATSPSDEDDIDRLPEMPVDRFRGNDFNDLEDEDDEY